MYSTCRFIVSPDSSEEACGCNGDDNYGNYGDDDELDGGDGDDDYLDGGDDESTATGTASSWKTLIITIIRIIFS